MIYYIDFLSKPASNMNAEMLKVEKNDKKKAKLIKSIQLILKSLENPPEWFSYNN